MPFASIHKRNNITFTLCVNKVYRYHKKNVNQPL